MMRFGTAAKARKKPSPKFSFLMAALFVLLAVWVASGDDTAYMVALLCLAVIWAVLGTVSAYKPHNRHSHD